ncbi:NADPH:quinone reductase [Paraburkholderia fungorum]|uniref:NADPH:quinone reductase n=1 Tax=Paraburkholderia fungorum TaxID=134537 RepID=A0A1H1HXF1_9BURK|nr:zinc-binding dehydrogenase [Paraburkholderia fungorum]SDR30147.1 NADPH:quinone reductase [Paraburkholderia fungorum]
MQRELPASWRAWVWRGGASPLDLVLERVTRPAIAPGEVLVRNAVIGLNPVDWKVLGDEQLDWQPGHVPGVDGAGTVVAIGDGVPHDLLGQRVAYHQSLHRHGSFAEYTSIRAEVLLRVPANMDFAVAASFPCPALTAFQAIEKLPPGRGRTLLISGAGGAVGRYLVQLAVARGFAVTAMCNRRHWERLLALGVDECIEGPLGDGQAWPVNDPKRFFAIIDSVDADHAARLAPALLANGHLVCIQGRVAQWPCAPFGRALSMHEVALGALHVYGDSAAWNALTQAGEQMLGEIAAGQLQAEPGIVGDFEGLAEQLDALRQRRFSGKPLVAVEPIRHTGPV